MKNKLTIAGIVLGILVVSILGYKAVANVKGGYNEFINNDLVGENTTIEDDYKSTKNTINENEMGNSITHDSDLSSIIEKSDVKGQVVDVETESVETESVEAALNIINPTLNLDATSALLMDAGTGKVIFHKNATARVYPASTVKIMTALVALDKCNKEEEITIGDEISLMAIDSSRAYLNKGEKLTLMMLLEGLLLPSGNDAAYSIAAYVGRKVSMDNAMPVYEAVEVFIGLMNEKAKILGLKNTHFMNPDGYDHDKQYTTAYDMAIIAKEALNNELICSITKMQRTRNIFLSGEDVTWKSGNKLISAGSGVYYKYAIGLKSGTSSLAGRCMVSAAKKEDKTYISVVMNSTATGRWEDSLTLLKYGIEN
jgi:D-alanyl-D-alanine carboxypeptidase